MKTTLRFAALFLFINLVAAAEPKAKADPFAALKFRNVGPAAGGRVSRVAGVPGDPLTYYAATSGGGVWKSSDGGINWKCITDNLRDSSMGSIAVAPSDPNVIYVGGGEANIRGNVQVGHGIYKSTDAGKTWDHVWKGLGQIGTIAVHPKNPDIAFAAVLGSAFGPGSERGVYRTKDGGKTWERVLSKDEDTGASDVAIDPNNPRIIFAGLWQARRQPWEMTSGGPGSGLYVSRDGGDTWTQLGPTTNDGRQPAQGLPKGIWGKIGVAVAPSNSQRVYAIIEADDGGLFRSDDGGDTWVRVSDSRALRQRAFYYSTLTVDPTNADVVWAPQVPLLKSIDGGVTFNSVRGCHHGDHHDIWIDPANPKRIIDANDGGVDISVDGGKTWYAPPLPISQFYHVSTDTAVPYRVLGNMQDLGTAAGPSRSLKGGRIRLADWETVGGGETGFTVADPSNPDIIYSGEYGGIITRFDRKTGQAKNVSIYPFNPSGHAPADLKYRFQWTAPILVSKHDPKTVYHGANVIFRTTDGGQTWKAISGDLTRNEKPKQQWSGGPITGDNTGVEIFGTVFTIAESPKEKGVLWAGSDDGLVHVSKNGGETWENVTANMPGMPEWGTVKCIEASPFDAGAAYVTAHAYRLNDFKPYVWKTTDFGKTWTKLSDNLPRDVHLHAIRSDTVKPGLLFLATERGVMVSRDDGKNWQPLQSGLPNVCVNDLVVKDNDLVVATQGRSLWILDDFSPLREWSSKVRKEPLHVFNIPPTTRWRSGGGFGFTGIGAADNPPTGTVVSYHLDKKTDKPLKLQILDAAGKVVFEAKGKKDKSTAVGAPTPKDDDEEDDEITEMELPNERGLHRVVWNLLTKGAEAIPGARVDSGNPRIGIPVPPGKYTLKLTADGTTATTPFEVVADPRVQTDYNEQYELALKVRDDITTLTRTVQQVRAVQRQLLARNKLLTGDKKFDALRKASKELADKFEALEGKLHNPKARITYDILAQKGGAKLYSQLVYTYGNLIDADGPPTQGVKEIYAEQAAELRKLIDEFKALTTGDLAKLNDEAKKLELPTIFVPPPKSAKANSDG
jgi:photosystem II stability/assembly factor-like uncharacterized protein